MSFDLKKSMKWIISGSCLILFLLLILFVKCIDVASIGPAGTAIGLSHLNGAIRDLVGVHKILYYLTVLLGIAALLFAGLFAAAGVVQWVRRKSLKKVDREILCLGGLYVVLMLVYAFFEKVVVNCRPVLEEGQSVPEASFPSSHTMLACVIFGSAIFVLDKYISDKKALSIFRWALSGVILVTVICRLLCGVHWFTDIIGGVLISGSLVFAFSAFLDLVRRKN